MTTSVLGRLLDLEALLTLVVTRGNRNHLGEVYLCLKRVR